MDGSPPAPATRASSGEPRMIDRKRIEDMVRAALGEAASPDRPIDTSGSCVIPPDRGVNLGAPFDAGALQAATPARICVGRTGNGTRYRTNTLLRFRADHAAAKDAVTSDVDPKLIE